MPSQRKYLAKYPMEFIRPTVPSMNMRRVNMNGQPKMGGYSDVSNQIGLILTMTVEMV